ncbi:MAG: hypothetical protein GY938_22590 [Ketobacter sp.]|nr:hypothetical protein [Ketobacter sp.]
MSTIFKPDFAAVLLPDKRAFNAGADDALIPRYATLGRYANALTTRVTVNIIHSIARGSRICYNADDEPPRHYALRGLYPRRAFFTLLN